MARPGRFGEIVESLKRVVSCPVTVKMRSGISDDKLLAEKLIPRLKKWRVDLITVLTTASGFAASARLRRCAG